MTVRVKLAIAGGALALWLLSRKASAAAKCGAGAHWVAVASSPNGGYCATDVCTDCVQLSSSQPFDGSLITSPTQVPDAGGANDPQWDPLAEF